jgi:hypothetical protein
MAAVDFKPTFQAEYVNGPFTRMVMHIEEEVRDVGPLKNKQIISRKIVPKREEFSGGYMIYFPQGHSMFVAADDADQLSRIGVGDRPKIVDMNSGDEVPDNLNLSPKEIVERAQHNRPRARSSGGLTEIMEGNLDA